jgi:hypothetical protein
LEVTVIIVSAAATSFLAPALQAAEGGSVIPWWLWLILVSVLLLLLLIGFVLQSKPGEPIPKPEERAMAPTDVAENSVEEEARETPAGPGVVSGEE